MKFSIARDNTANDKDVQLLTKRRGGGGGGRGGGSSSGGGAKSSGSSSSSSGSSSSGKSGSGSSGSSGRAADGSSTSSTSLGFTPGSVSGGSTVRGSRYGTGMASPFTVSSGAFAGRQAGGATRGSIYGSSQYGSGYPSNYGTRGTYYGGGVGGRGFPFIFWPVVFPGGAYYGSGEYANMSGSRPGGQLAQYSLMPWTNITDTASNQLALYGDLNSVDSTFQYLVQQCQIPNTLADNFTVNFNQAIEYYRASSFALLLNGYNNTQPLGNDTAPDSTMTTMPPLPSGANMDYINCINTTIGQTVPLIDAVENSSAHLAATQPALLALISLLVVMLSQLLA